MRLLWTTSMLHKSEPVLDARRSVNFPPWYYLPIFSFEQGSSNNTVICCRIPIDPFKYIASLRVYLRVSSLGGLGLTARGSLKVYL